ncbi:MAG: 30S ribosomal protein S2 [Patescibacteria group bacterium]
MANNTDNTLIERLFNAGAHFGFSKSRRHPTVAPYLFGTKNGNDIFDLEKTAELIETAKAVVTEAGKNGKTVLFVGTKEEASRLVREAAEKAEQPYVVNRWIGGMITNFGEIKKRIARLKELNDEKESGELERKYTKKERVLFDREVDKLSFNFGGIKTIERNPDLMIVVDPRHDAIAVTEAGEANIPVIGITSSDANLGPITHPVILNDALQSSLSLAIDELAEAYVAGRKEYTPKPVAPRGGNARYRRPRDNA